MVGDLPQIAIVGRDGGGAYSSPGVVAGVGVSAAVRVAVRYKDGTTRWLDTFDCAAFLAPGTASWRCDGDSGPLVAGQSPGRLAVNLTVHALQENQTGLVMTAEHNAAAAVVLEWRLVLTGQAGDTLGISRSRSNLAKVKLTTTANHSGPGQQVWGPYTELHAAAVPNGTASAVNATDAAAGAMLTTPPSLDGRSRLLVQFGYNGFDTIAVEEALSRLERQRAMFDPSFYAKIAGKHAGSWFDSWIGRSLNPEAKLDHLLKPTALEAAVEASERWNARRRPLKLQTPDVHFDVALAHCSGEMQYQYEHPGFLHGASFSFPFCRVL
eukprot:SAG31_NODE_216_length_20053_cov_9.223815_2_plen_325_part_00